VNVWASLHVLQLIKRVEATPYLFSLSLLLRIPHPLTFFFCSVTVVVVVLSCYGQSCLYNVKDCWKRSVI
jgi:hypothetical protein